MVNIYFLDDELFDDSLFNGSIHAHYVITISDYYINNTIKTLLFLIKKEIKLVKYFN